MLNPNPFNFEMLFSLILSWVYVRLGYFFFFSHKTLWSQSNILDYIPCFWDKVRESPWVICLGRVPQLFSIHWWREGIGKEAIYLFYLFIKKMYMASQLTHSDSGHLAGIKRLLYVFFLLLSTFFSETYI